jgi:hypothetical protein
MSARTAAVVPRLIGIVLVCLLATAAVTFAASGTGGSQQPAAAAPAPTGPAVLAVPDVRSQAYVFAKGTLEDAGFAWKVVGPVKGYAAHSVVSQSPAAGTRVVDTGAPLVTVQLERNGRYGEKGAPENESPYAGTALELAPFEGQQTSEAAPATPATPAAAKPAAAKTAAKTSSPKPAKKKSRATADKRPPAFAVSGAPKEPLDEIPLDERARRLTAWFDSRPAKTNANVAHWLYQHNWIVTGARFGWWRGAEALAILVQVDRRVERTWGVGSRSRAVAEQALVEVKGRSRGA